MRLFVPSLGGGWETIITEAPLGGQGIQGLLGRDFLSLVDFLERAEDLSESVASVESVTLVRDLADDLAVWGVAAPQLVMVDEPAFLRFRRWSLEILAALAQGDPGSLAPRTVFTRPIDGSVSDV